MKDAAQVATRLKDVQLSGLCLSLVDNVNIISDHYDTPSEKEINLIRKVTMAFKMAMTAAAPEELGAGSEFAQYSSAS